MELKNFKLLDGQTKKVGAHISSGIFDIYIHDNVIYKKAKAELINVRDESIFQKYKYVIENAYKNKHNHTIMGYDVERDGSYKCRYIKGYRLDKINDSNINKSCMLKIKEQILLLKNDLNANKDKLYGDWALHNLIYSINDNKIYNIDIEGFYPCHLSSNSGGLPHWGSITKINKWLSNLIK